MIAGRYSLDREIGRGGMGAVWLGRDEVLGRPVAIKRVGLAPGATTPDQLRAEREARIAASLNHPHIVGVYDLVHEDEKQWLVMEYVEGRTLADIVRTHGPMPPDQLAPIIAQAASALAAAHARDIVHRDVKPSNILVREDGTAKLTDFGIARSLDDATMTQTGLVTGSPAYLAPEVASGKQATAASDVWSLGATLFHALAGHAPYEVTDNVLGALYRIVNEPPPRLDDPGEMGPLLLSTMAHDARERWSMIDVVHFLDQSSAMAGRPPTPLPGTPEERTRTLVTEPLAQAAPPALPPVPPPVLPPASTPAAEQVPEPVVLAPTPVGGRSRRRIGTLPLVVAAVVGALVILIVVLALQDDPQTALDGRDAPSSSAPPTDDASSDPGDPGGSGRPAPTEDEMRSFVESYLQTASTDPGAGFEQLTPQYQRASPNYTGFWGGVDDPQIVTFSADPTTLVATYDYRYRLNGKREQECVRLQLVQRGQGFLISGATTC